MLTEEVYQPTSNNLKQVKLHKDGYFELREYDKDLKKTVKSPKQYHTVGGKLIAAGVDTGTYKGGHAKGKPYEHYNVILSSVDTGTGEETLFLVSWGLKSGKGFTNGIATLKEGDEIVLTAEEEGGYAQTQVTYKETGRWTETAEPLVKGKQITDDMLRPYWDKFRQNMPDTEPYMPWQKDETSESTGFEESGTSRVASLHEQVQEDEPKEDLLKF